MATITQLGKATRPADAVYVSDDDGPIPRWLPGTHHGNSDEYKMIARLFRRLLKDNGGADNLSLAKLMLCELAIQKFDKACQMARDSMTMPIEYGVYVNLCNSLTGDLNKLGWDYQAAQETATHRIQGSTNV